MEDSDGEASSPPLDEPDGPNQPEAITTAAAYNSPMLFSSKLAQKRFNTGALYAESDHPYEDDSDNHVASSIERYRTPRIRPKIYENGYSATTKRTSQGVRANSTRHTFSRVLELLPFRIQRLFNKRRKKILSPELHIEPHREQASRRPTLLFLLSCVVIAGLVYLVFPSDQAAQTAGDLVQEDTSSDAQHIQKPSLPARKWWEASPDPAVQKKRKGRM